MYLCTLKVANILYVYQIHTCQVSGFTLSLQIFPDVPSPRHMQETKVALTGFMRYFICRVVLKKLTSSTFVPYYFTILSYISIKFSDNVLS